MDLQFIDDVVDFNVMLSIENEEDIYINIIDKDQVRNIEIASGMEKVISSIAIRAALASISVFPKPTIFFLDEAFSSLDTEHLYNMNNLLLKLKNVFGTVVCISHIEEMKDIMDHFIHVEKNNDNYSELRIE